ncbi:malonate transporter [Enhygromyxa salina]|uniref:Malonate transporter n=1 Tax=Enhygromyxa salina TaxID=215803 RepID=A0A0C2CWL7_9BACT|nr:AEC family transporter [Enhygromyxa salina]KIG14015.1 malonate transporter [Enhygromyxa salina]
MWRSGSLAIVLAAASPLLLALAAGFVFGLTKLFERPEHAIAALNRFCLYLAFPALIFANVYTAEFAMRELAGFTAATIVPTLVLLLLLGASTRRLEPHARGAMGLGAGLGNIAYLGIPSCAAVLGPQVVGLASLSAALHIVVTIPLGTWLLLRWGPRASTQTRARPLSGPLARALRQPLVWAPILALLARAAPEAWLVPVIGPMQWIGGAASPVALFMIGLYLHAQRRELLRLRWTDAMMIAAKLFVLPALALACVLACLELDAISLEAGKVVLIQASMPTAITTFALAEEYGIGRETIVRGIVGSTIVFMLSFPLLAPLLLARL